VLICLLRGQINRTNDSNTRPLLPTKAAAATTTNYYGTNSSSKQASRRSRSRSRSRSSSIKKIDKKRTAKSFLGILPSNFSRTKSDTLVRREHFSRMDSCNSIDQLHLREHDPINSLSYPMMSMSSPTIHSSSPLILSPITTDDDHEDFEKDNGDEEKIPARCHPNEAPDLQQRQHARGPYLSLLEDDFEEEGLFERHSTLVVQEEEGVKDVINDDVTPSSVQFPQLEIDESGVMIVTYMSTPSLSCSCIVPSESKKKNKQEKDKDDRKKEQQRRRSKSRSSSTTRRRRTRRKPKQQQERVPSVILMNKKISSRGADQGVCTTIEISRKTVCNTAA